MEGLKIVIEDPEALLPDRANQFLPDPEFG